MSDFWIRKMKTYFQRCDRDGLLSQREFSGIANKFAQYGRLNDEQCEEFKRLMNILFGKFTDGDTEKPLTEDKFVESLRKHVQDPAFSENLRDPLTIAFKAVDANDDGSIHVEELMFFYEIIGFKDDKQLGQEAFDALDTNKSGAITLDEWVAAGIDFFTGNDESSPGKLFWGPLV